MVNENLYNTHPFDVTFRTRRTMTAEGGKKGERGGGRGGKGIGEMRSVAFIFLPYFCHLGQAHHRSPTASGNGGKKGKERERSEVGLPSLYPNTSSLRSTPWPLMVRRSPKKKEKGKKERGEREERNRQELTHNYNISLILLLCHCDALVWRRSGGRG